MLLDEDLADLGVGELSEGRLSEQQRAYEQTRQTHRQSVLPSTH